MSSTMTAPPAEMTKTLEDQARQMSEHYPELYDHLRRRDRAIERALARIPSRADVELSSVFNARRYLEQTMKSLAPGVGDLNGVDVAKPPMQDGPTGEELIDG